MRISPVARFLSLWAFCLGTAFAQKPAALYAGTFQAGVWRSADGGITWSATGSGTSPAWGPTYGLAADPNDPRTLYAAGVGIYRSSDGGDNWTQLTIGDTQPVVLALAIDPEDSKTIYAGTIDGGLLQSKDAGTSWNPTSLTAQAISAVAVDPKNSNTVYAGGPASLYKSSSGAGGFTPSQTVKLVNAIAVDPTNSSVAYAASGSGIFKSIDAGSSWTQLNCSCAADTVFSAIWIDPANSANIFAGGADPPLNAIVLKSTNGGNTWVPLNNGIATEQIQAITGITQSGILLAASQGPDGLYFSENQGSTWAVAAGGFPAGAEVLSLASSGSILAPSILSVVNAASNQPPIQANSWIAIKGIGFTTTTRSWNPPTEIVNGALPLSLDGISVTVNGKAAAIYFISPTQINALSPIDDAIGTVSLVVANSNGPSTPYAIQMQRESPALFLLNPPNQTPKYPAATLPNGSLLGPPGLFGADVTTKSAKPGDVATLFGTGCGPTDPPVPSVRTFSDPGLAVDTVTVTVGGASAKLLFAGMSAPGVCQFNIVVPDIPAGDQPLSVLVGGAATQNDVFLNIALTSTP